MAETQPDKFDKLADTVRRLRVNVQCRHDWNKRACDKRHESDDPVGAEVYQTAANTCEAIRDAIDMMMAEHGIER